jgi:hypothetical protein
MVCDALHESLPEYLLKKKNIENYIQKKGKRKKEKEAHKFVKHSHGALNFWSAHPVSTACATAPDATYQHAGASQCIHSCRLSLFTIIDSSHQFIQESYGRCSACWP